MIRFRIKEEHLYTYNKLSYILPEKNSSITDTRPLKAMIDQAQDKSRSTENQNAVKKRTEPDKTIPRM